MVYVTRNPKDWNVVVCTLERRETKKIFSIVELEVAYWDHTIPFKVSGDKGLCSQHVVSLVDLT